MLPRFIFWLIKCERDTFLMVIVIMCIEHIVFAGKPKLEFLQWLCNLGFCSKFGFNIRKSGNNMKGLHLLSPCEKQEDSRQIESQLIELFPTPKAYPDLDRSKYIC